MSDQVKKYYLAVQGLEELIRINEIDYQGIVERIQTESSGIMRIQSETKSEQTYVIPIEKVNYFIIEKVEDEVGIKED